MGNVFLRGFKSDCKIFFKNLLNKYMKLLTLIKFEIINLDAELTKVTMKLFLEYYSFIIIKISYFCLIILTYFRPLQAAKNFIFFV